MQHHAVIAPRIPDRFCWTRFGTEAGESIERILDRKEGERLANDGVFFWGIGNSVGPGLAELLESENQPQVLFSAIKSRPRLVDSSPSLVVRWLAGTTLAGDRIELPSATCVTSQVSSLEQAKSHYALVCSRDEPLRLADHGRLSFDRLRNLRSGNPVGSSQVTAVVRQVQATGANTPDYVVALAAELAAPYFVRLSEPVAHSVPAERAA